MAETSDPSVLKHFGRNRFYNPKASQAPGVRDVLRWKLTSHAQSSPPYVFDIEPSPPPPTVESGEIRATVVNHSTVLLQQRASNILTDPIWSKRASPISWIGPRRRRKPGVRMEDLPKIDVVLISHNHYDHLDLPTLRWLARRGTSEFIVPVGVARLLRSEKIEAVSELDWGEARTVGRTKITSVPALHFSGRGILDRNKTLWCGYVISSPEGIVYFAGDTAFGSHFTDIRETFGPPRLALLPIGAYEPKWFMSPVHMAPDEAIRAHHLLGSGTSIAIHHGTFQLADDAIDTAMQDFQTFSPPDTFIVLKNGESVGLV